jgi:hypothetical protein
MSKSAFPGSPDHAATLRRMNFLVVLLVVSNIATGVFSVFLLRNLDARYSELISQSVPELNDLRELMTDTVMAMEATNPRYFLGSNAKAPEALQTVRQRLATGQRFRTDTLKDRGFAVTPSDRAAIQKVGEEFDRIAAELSRLYSAGSLNEAVRLREERLRPAFDQYFAAIGTAADAIEAHSLSTSNDYTVKTHSLTAVVLGVAGWPLIVMMALLLLTVCFVVVLMFVFRGKELGDMP